jgi:hypothetical protein
LTDSSANPKNEHNTAARKELCMAPARQYFVLRFVSVEGGNSAANSARSSMILMM